MTARNQTAREKEREKSPLLAKYFYAVVGVGVVLAIIISVIIGAQQSIWFDEAYSIILAKKPVAELMAFTAVDTHPPFYYLLLKAWASLFGWTDVSLRLLSAVCMGAAAGIGVLFVKRFFGLRAALMSLVLVVVSPFLLRYGFEVRMYALASLIGVAASYVLLLAVTARQGRRQTLLYIVYAILLALGVYTLYYMALLWITHLVWLLWYTHNQKRPILKQHWWFSFIGGALLFAPWLPSFIHQITHSALAPIAERMTLDNAVGIVSFLFLYSSTWQLNAVTWITVLLAIGLVAYASFKAFSVAKNDEKAKPAFLFLAMYAALPIVLITLISAITPMYVERYLSHTLIGVSLFLGVALNYVRRQNRQVALLIFGYFGLLSCFGVAHLAQIGNLNFQRNETPAGKLVAAQLSDVCQTKTPIIVKTIYSYIDTSHYFNDCPRFVYDEFNPEFKGGYAPLHNSPLLLVEDFSKLKDEQKVITVRYSNDASLEEKAMQYGFKLDKVEAAGPFTIETYNKN